MPRLGWSELRERGRVPLRNVELSKFQITHFYGLSDVRYSGLRDFILNRVSAWPYIKIHIVRVVNRIDRYFFNKKKLITKQRMDLLKILLERHLDGKSKFDPISLMTDLYSIRWVQHPYRDSLKHKLEFYLDSMIETGELDHPQQLSGCWQGGTGYRRIRRARAQAHRKR